MSTDFPATSSDVPATAAASRPEPFDWAAIQDRIAGATQAYAAASGAAVRQDAAEVAARLLRLYQAADAPKERATR